MIDAIAREKQSLGAGDLLSEVAGSVQTQQYGGKPRIEGVELVELKAMLDAGGLFLETARLDGEGRLQSFAHRDFRVRQANYSEMEPGEMNPDLADQFPFPTSAQPNTVGFLEDGVEGNNGFVWAPPPGSGAPGDTGSPVQYNLISDVPEPGSITLLLAGAGLLGFRRIRQKLAS